MQSLENLQIPVLSASTRQAVQADWEAMDKPLQSLGNLEIMVEKYAAMTAAPIPKHLKTAMLLMCGDHGIAKYGVSAYPPEVTIQMINGYMRETAGANVMARHAQADVFVVDVGVNADLSHLKKVRNLKVAWGTADFTQGPAMTKQQAKQAFRAGMLVADECIDQGYNLLATAEMGIGNTTATAALASAFLGLPPELTVGRGTGINDERMRIKRQVVIDGLAINRPLATDAWDVLCKVGGYDHAGLAGMIVAGARRRVPTMVDGVNATAAALVAYGLYPQCADYMLCSHLSAEIAHAKMLELLHLKPIVDAGMRLGEGTGASLAVVILQAAMDIYNEMKIKA
ncbi:MAG: nicotinate-nucleotide--dimethylbenzimidazole phosphoribosyltransferase [Acidaminococcaceae bacterium]